MFFYQITCKKSLGVAFIGCPDQKTTYIHPRNRPIAQKLPSQLPRFLPRAFDIVHRPVGGSGTDRYGVRMGTAPIGSRVVLNYDLTPAEWASGSVTMRFLVENYPMKVIPTFFEGSTMFDRYVSYVSYGRYKDENFKTAIPQEKWGASLHRGSFRRGIAW